MLKGSHSHHPAHNSPQHKWSESLALHQHAHWGPRVKQASAHTYLDPSVPSHSTWQSLDPSNPLTLLTVDYGLQILEGEDADGMSRGTGAKLSSYSGEHKSGPCPNSVTSFYGERGAPSLLTLSRSCHTLFVRLPTERTKVVTIGVPLNKYGLEMLLFLFFFKSGSGLSALWYWTWSRKSSASAEHKATPKCSWLSSFWPLSDFGGLWMCVFLWMIWAIGGESI